MVISTKLPTITTKPNKNNQSSFTSRITDGLAGMGRIGCALLTKG